MNRIFCLLAVLFLALPAQAQERSTYLAEILALRDKFDVTFVYNASLRLDQTCAPVRQQSTLSRSLRDLFKGSGIEYDIQGHTVILRRRTSVGNPDYDEVNYKPIIDTLPPSRVEASWKDTLRAAIITDSQRMELSLGHLQTGLEGIRAVVSPMGEGDPIRWAQSLPGVTTGADGTTAMYVRGGGSGNNLFSLDGVPVYGYSHILGLTTIVPTQVMESAELGKGGFDGAESNFTAAHLRVVTKAPSKTQKWSAALNTFLASVGAEGPIGKKLSYIVSARVSPLTWEYRAMRKMLPGVLGSLDKFSATVGDAYAKLRWELDQANSIEVSFLGNQDRYCFDTPDASHEVMGWNNLVGVVRFKRDWERTRLELRASANRYGSSQEQDKVYRETANHLSLRSTLTEYTLAGDMHHRLDGDRLSLGEGLSLRYAQFAPGQVASVTNRSDVLLATAWVRADYTVPERLSLKATLRGNYFRNLTGTVGRIDPEASLSAKVNLTRWLSLELTGDRLVQYYHTLEGLPLGWSLDMIVPSGAAVRPETALQGNAGLSGRVGAHSFSLGGFYKAMDGLVYYKYAQSLFSGALAAWEDHVDIGKGTAYGAEFLYEYQGKEWYARLSYTLSKTTRHDFAETNEGRPFHARFDRRHVLNATAQWRGFTATVILQSGHWENGAAETYPMHVPGGVWTADYYSGVNNYHMPTVFRLDLGWQKSFTTGRVEHTVNVGVCNVTNHFNPFMLYFDTSTESWKEIALLPILPNLSWRISF